MYETSGLFFSRPFYNTFGRISTEKTILSADIFRMQAGKRRFLSEKRIARGGRL